MIKFVSVISFPRGTVQAGITWLSETEMADNLGLILPDTSDPAEQVTTVVGLIGLFLCNTSEGMSGNSQRQVLADFDAMNMAGHGTGSLSTVHLGLGANSVRQRDPNH